MCKVHSKTKSSFGSSPKLNLSRVFLPFKCAMCVYIGMEQSTNDDDDEEEPPEKQNSGAFRQSVRTPQQA